MAKFVSLYLTRLISLLFLVLCGPVLAAEWQPFCIEGSSCEFPYNVNLGGLRYVPNYPIIDRYAAGPLVTNEGIFLHHSPPQSDTEKRHVFQLSPNGLTDFGDRLGLVSDFNAIQSPGGKSFSFGLGSALAWFFPGEDIETIAWPGDVFFVLSMIGPPVSLDDVIYIGTVGFAGASVFLSADGGSSWSSVQFLFNVFGDRFSLLQNPEKDALWVIESEYLDSSGGLWELVDGSVPWTQVDDGSFPADTVRVVHDPDDSMVSYALTRHGLFVSVNRGVSWQITSLTEPVHGIVFVERLLGLSRAIIVGTDTGVLVSVDEAASWVSMARGLPEIPHTATYGHGQLIATSDWGYFTCNAIDCAGFATPVELATAEIETHWGADRVTVSWKPVDYATVYRVFRCLDENVESCGLPIAFPRATSFDDFNATPSIIYQYRVRACVKNNCGDFSAPVSGLIRLPTPTDIEASDGAFNDHVRISWGPVDGAIVYRVFRCLDPFYLSCGWPIGFPRGTFFDDTKATAGTVFHYRVRACTTVTCSRFSESDTGHTN